jgi:hypothetical protein
MDKLTPRAKSILQRLRPGLPLSTAGFSGMSSATAVKALEELAALGLVEKRGRSTATVYLITDAGRRACPPRNPIAARRTIVRPVQGDNVRGPTIHSTARPTVLTVEAQP